MKTAAYVLYQYSVGIGTIPRDFSRSLNLSTKWKGKNG